MTEYINREDVLDIIQERIKDIDNHEMSDVWRARKAMAMHFFREVQHLFAADVRENVRGEYIGAQTKYKTVAKRRCSACGIYSEVWNFCGNCGADMRGNAE